MLDSDIYDLINATTSPVKPQTQSFVQALTIAWTTERHSPDILPYKHALLEAANEKLRFQIEMVETLNIEDSKSAFRLVIVQTEMERVRFLVRSYLRTRISKIDRFLMFCSREAAIVGRLSPVERHYAEKHQAVLERHLHNSFLRDFPETGQLQKLDDTGAAGMSMIDKPDLHKAVFIKVVRDLGQRVKIGMEQIDLDVHSIVLIRYNIVQQYLHNVSAILCTVTGVLTAARSPSR